MTIKFKFFLYYLGAMLLIGAKSIGLEERSGSFLILFAVGSFCILMKMLLEEHPVSELLLFALLVSYGVYAFFNMGSVGLLSLVILLVGMKGIELRPLFKVISVEYTVCFILTVLTSIFGDRDGVELIHEKFGRVLLRQSLGYTHPNVLHVTYVILMALIIYAADKHGKELIKLLALLLTGDAFVFMYSLSNTGLLMSLALVIAILYMEIVHYRDGSKSSVSKAEKLLLNIWVPFSILGFIVLSRAVSLNNDVYVKANEIFNMRTWCINMYFDNVGLSLFGKPLSLQGVALDNSYAYALFAYGTVFFIMMFAAYWVAMRYLIKSNRLSEIAVMVVLMFGGITEQFMFNASIKNITVFMIGEWLFNSVFLSKLNVLPVGSKKLRFLSGSTLSEKELKFKGIKRIMTDRKLLSRVALKAVIFAIISVIVLLAKSQGEYEIVYASPKAVDVSMDESDISVFDEADSESYYVGYIDVHEEIYVFSNDNSDIIKQMKVYRVITAVFLMIMCTGVGIRVFRSVRG